MRRILVVPAVLVASLTARAQLGPEPDWTRLQDETLRHFQAIVRLDTSNPPGNEKLVTDYVKSELEKEGIAVQILALEPNRPNLVARIKGNGRKQPILYMGHSDVVTVDPKKWTFPPFSAARDGGYIYGRGTLDDKPHVVAGLMMMLELKRQKVALDRDVIFLVESGEEGTTSVGIGFLTRQHPEAIRAEYCFAEGGSVARSDGKVRYASMQATEKLPRRIELTATGTAGHGSRPLRDNAIAHLSAAVAKLAEWRVPVRLNDTTRAFFTRMADVSSPADAARYRAVLTPDSPAAREAIEYFAEHEPGYASMLRTSISPTVITGGYRVNVIPSEAKATLDVRMVPDEDPEQFMAEVRRIINDPAVTASYINDPGQLRPAGKPAQLDTEAASAIQSSVARDYDTVTIPTMSTGATDMSQVRAMGTQCYGIGPASDLEDGPKGFGAHSDQERILEAELYRFVKFSWDVVVGLARARSN